MILRICVFLLLSSCAKESYAWYDGSLTDALSQISGDSDKILFLDFYSDN